MFGYVRPLRAELKVYADKLEEIEARFECYSEHLHQGGGAAAAAQTQAAEAQSRQFME